MEFFSFEQNSKLNQKNETTNMYAYIYELIK